MFRWLAWKIAHIYLMIPCWLGRHRGRMYGQIWCCGNCNYTKRMDGREEEGMIERRLMDIDDSHYSEEN